MPWDKLPRHLEFTRKLDQRIRRFPLSKEKSIDAACASRRSASNERQCSYILNPLFQMWPMLQYMTSFMYSRTTCNSFLSKALRVYIQAQERVWFLSFAYSLPIKGICAQWQFVNLQVVRTENVFLLEFNSDWWCFGRKFKISPRAYICVQPWIHTDSEADLYGPTIDPLFQHLARFGGCSSFALKSRIFVALVGGFLM